MSKPERIAVVWLEVQTPGPSHHCQTNRRLVLCTRSHRLTISDSFAAELFDVAEAAADQSGCLRRMLALMQPAIEQAQTRIVEGRRDQVKQAWSDEEKKQRGRADDKPVRWSVPETSFEFERPPKPHDQ